MDPTSKYLQYKYDNWENGRGARKKCGAGGHKYKYPEQYSSETLLTKIVLIQTCTNSDSSMFKSGNQRYVSFKG